MKITDACVYPYPVGDSSVRRFALEARSFGYDSIVAADTPAAGLRYNRDPRDIPCRHPGKGRPEQGKKKQGHG